MIQGFNESSLSTSEIFQGFTEYAKEDQVEKAKKLINTVKPLSNVDIESAYVGVKQYANLLSRAAIKAFDDGDIILLYQDVSTLSVSKALPFITFNRSDGWKTYVFLDNYITRSKQGVLNIHTNILHDLLIGALISNRLKTKYSLLTTNQSLTRLLMDIYTKFVTHIFNKQFSIKAEKIPFDCLQYWINKFFLINVLGSNDGMETIDILSIKNLKYIDELKIHEIKTAYDEANPSKISELLELCKTANPTRMGSLVLSTFSSNWINYFYPPAFLAIDVIEYLIFMIICLLHGNNIVSIAASEMVKETKNIKAFEEELIKLI